MTRQNGLHYGGRQEAVLALLDGTRTDAEIARSTGASRSYVRVVAKRNGKAHLVKPQRVTNGLAAVQADLAAALDRIAELEADKVGLQDQVGRLLKQVDDDFEAVNGPNALTMHTYGQTPAWYVEAAFWASYGYSPNDARAVLTSAPTGQEGA